MSVEDQDALTNAVSETLQESDPKEIITPEEEGKLKEGEQRPAGEGEPAGTEDPLIELSDGTKVKQSVLDNHEFEISPGRKVKFSDLGKGYMLQEDYTKKTTAVSEKEKSITEVLNFIGKVKQDPEASKALIAFAEKGLGNPEKIKRMLASLEDIQGKVEDKTEDIEKQLEGLDPDDPAYKVTKALLTELKATKAVITKLQADTESKKNADAVNLQQGKDQQNKEQLEKNIVTAQTALKTTMQSSVDEFKEILNTDRKKALWSRMVIAYLREHPEKYDTEEIFVNRIKSVGKDTAQEIKMMSEESLAAYLKKKKTPVAPPGLVNAAKQEAEPESLQEQIEKGLKEQVEKTT